MVYLLGRRNMRQKPGRKPKEWTLEQIVAKGRPFNDCLIWTGGKHSQLGYGMMRYKTKMRTVHSVIAEIKYGTKPTKYTGTRVSRTCNEPACCNPEHIVIVDAGSLQRGKAAERGRFTDEEIKDIRNRYDNEYYWGIVSDLSKEYEVKPNHMSAICRRWIYKKVEQ